MNWTLFFISAKTKNAKSMKKRGKKNSMRKKIAKKIVKRSKSNEEDYGEENLGGCRMR